jgi:hypothetical protein
MSYSEITVQVDGLAAVTKFFKISSGLKVSALKDKIKTQIPTILKTEYALHNGAVSLDDTKTLHAQGIVNNTKLTADFHSISVTVKILDQDKTLSVDPDFKVSTIMDKLTGEGFELGYTLNKGGAALNITKTIARSGIKNGDVLVADYNEIAIKYKVLGKTVTINVDPDNKVSTIRDAIKTKESITTDGFQLKIGATVLTDMNKTIVASGIRKDTLIEVDYTGISINVKVPSGQTITLEVDPDEHVQTIIDKVAQKESLNAATFTLKKDTTVLVSTKTIYESGITAGSTITVDIKSISIKVKIS